MKMDPYSLVLDSFLRGFIIMGGRHHTASEVRGDVMTTWAPITVLG
jgi:hypothetical protein